MVLRLDPAHPLVWRNPTTLQFGIERPVAVVRSSSRAFGGLAAPRELMLDVLARGVTRPVLSLLAAENGLPEAALDELLGELSGVLLESETSASPLEGRMIAVDGVGAAAEEIALLMRRMGGRLWGPGSGSGSVPGEAASARAPELAVVVSHFVTDPRRAAVWLRDDVPHLLVEFGERSVRIGPVVAPASSAGADDGFGADDGPGPCARCIEHTRCDADPAWPAIALQALRRTAPSADVLGVATAAPVVARVLAEFVSGCGAWRTHAVRIRRAEFAAVSGQADRVERSVSVERIRPHPSCGCRSLPGTETAGGLRCAVIRPPPRRARAAGEHG